MKLLSIQSDAKTIKGENSQDIQDLIKEQLKALGLAENSKFMTAILYLEPDEILCPHASKGCMAACLKSSGRMGMHMAENARLRRTGLWHKHRDAFLYMLTQEIEKFIKKAERKGLTPVVRLNGTSDIVWEAVRLDDGQTIFERFASVQFYDYTPNKYRLSRQLPPNYHLTFSLKEDNKRQALDALSEGHNVAVVFRKELPKQWHGFKVIDGDKHDLRFLDGQNVVVGLKAKGKARKDESGFVQDVEESYQPASFLQGALA